MPASPLAGKTALVTGAARGIGRAIALRLAADGASLVLHYGSSGAEAEAVKREIMAAGGAAPRLVKADLRTLAGVETLAAAVADGLDILVNNAGLQVAEGPDADEAAFDLLFAVNLKSAYFLIQKLSPALRDGGRIVNISSGLSRTAFPEKMVYGMTKAAMNVMTLSFAKQLGPRGIAVNAVLPGIIASDMNPWVRSPQAAPRVAALSVFNRVGEPEDVASVVAFLASDDSRWVTGELIGAGGGVHL